MAHYDWANTQSMSGGGNGGGYTVPNGGYILKILSAEFGRSNAGNDQLKITWDIAEGEHANIATNFGWFESKHTDYLSFSPRALGFTKGKLEAIAASNPSFDPFAAVDNDQWQQFVGRTFGATLKLEYGEWNGKQTKKMVIDQYLSVADIRSGNFVTPVTEEPLPPVESVPAAYAPPAASFAPTQQSGYQPQGQIPYPQPAPGDDESIPF